MANTRELRRRIRSVKNTSQITKAMQMVAATKMRRAQNQALGGRPYNEKLNFALSKILSKNDLRQSALMQPNSSKKVGVILLTTDKSLCGALNTNLFRYLSQFVKEHQDLVFYTIGKKGRHYVAKSGLDLVADFENTDSISFANAKQYAKLAAASFLAGEVGEVYVIYPDFVSTLTQNPKKMKVLPVNIEALREGVAESGLTDSKNLAHKKEQDEEFLLEPSADSLLDYAVKHFVDIKIYQALLETKASEHSARMIAMQNATDNALELVSDLTLTYNQTRQASITKELLEITTAQAAME